MFPEIDGASVQAIQMHPADRLVSVALSDASRLVIRMYGSRSNVLHTDASGTIRATFLRSRSEETSIEIPFPPAEERPLFERLQEHSESDPGMTLQMFLRRTVPMLGPVLVREVLFRSSLDGTTQLADVHTSAVHTITRILDGLLDELIHNPEPRIIFRNDEPVHFSLVSLHHLHDTTEEIISGISKGVLRFLSLRRKRDTFLSQKGAIQKNVAEEIERTVRSLNAVDRSVLSDSEIELLERNGKIIHLHISSMTKGMSSLDVNDPFLDEDTERSITLDPMLSPVKNAQRYFDRAKKARLRREDSIRRHRDLSTTLQRLQRAESEIDGASGQEDLDALAKEFGDVISATSPSTRNGRGKASRLPFRMYRVHGGFEVWVGKSSANNDLLTTRHTAKNDLWFHARGVGGSHVVLKAGTGKGEISKMAIEAAAAIAAHYSKMKNAKHVAVSMCFGKFVRKPRKAPPGTVTIEREEVLFVDPALPASEGE